MKENPPAVIPIKVYFKDHIYQMTEESGTCDKKDFVGNAYRITEEGEVIKQTSWNAYRVNNESIDKKIALKTFKNTCFVYVRRNQ